MTESKRITVWEAMQVQQQALLQELFTPFVHEVSFLSAEQRDQIKRDREKIEQEEAEEQEAIWREWCKLYGFGDPPTFDQIGQAKGGVQ